MSGKAQQKRSLNDITNNSSCASKNRKTNRQCVKESAPSLLQNQSKRKSKKVMKRERMQSVQKKCLPVRSKSVPPRRHLRSLRTKLKNTTGRARTVWEVWEVRLIVQALAYMMSDLKHTESQAIAHAQKMFGSCHKYIDKIWTHWKENNNAVSVDERTNKQPIHRRIQSHFQDLRDLQMPFYNFW
eukprot:535274_1